MLKKLIVTFLLGLPTYGFSLGIGQLANPNHWTNWNSGHWGSGFYLGAGLGADTTDFKEKAHVNLVRSFGVFNRTHLAAEGPFGTIFAGYSWHCPCKHLYVAGELNINWSSADFFGNNIEIFHETNSRTKYDVHRYWGVSLLPGLMLPETTLIYGRIGYTRGSFSINTTDASLRNANALLRGFRLGVGLEKRIYEQFSLRFEYSHINYLGHSQFTIDPLSAVTKRTIVTPHTNQFEIGFNYRFC